MSLFRELKRRNVVRVGIAYVVMGWLLLQLADFALDLIDAPNWVIQTLFVVVALGLPVALFFAWAFELTPEGIKREEQVDRSRSITARTGRKLDIAIMASLLMIAAYFIWEARFKPAPGPAAPATEVAGPSADAPPPDTVPGLPKDTIAVLPFANRSNEEGDLFFTDGIHDDLLTQLAKIDALKVISRTSVMTYRETDKRIPQIAEELGAGIILEGGVQRAGDRVRINAQLIDVATDQHLWADTFDREMTIDNLFDIQSEISRQIVAAVKGELTDEDIRSLDERPTDSLAAWEAYLRARAILRETDYETSKYERAAPYISLALEEDPEFILAWVLLAEIQMQGIWMGDRDTLAQRELARSSVDRAIALAPDTPAVLAARAEYEYRVNRDYGASLALIDQAIERAPSRVEYYHHRGLCLRRMGHFEAAVEAFDDAVALDPLDSYAAATQAETLAFMQDWARLEAVLDRWLPLDPDSYDLLFWKYRLLIDRDGDLDAARAVLDGAQLAPGTRLALAFEELPQLERDWDRLLEVARDPANEGFMPIMDLTRDFRIGRAHALAGERESAAPYLARYLEATRESPRYGGIGRGIQAANSALALAWMGDLEGALRQAREADAIMASVTDTIFDRWVTRTTTQVIARAGAREEALQRIAASIGQMGGDSPWLYYLDPAWDFMRDDPRFNELVRPDGVAPDLLRAQRLAEDS